MPVSELEVQLTLDDKFSEPLKTATKEVEQFRSSADMVNKEAVKGSEAVSKSNATLVKGMKESLKPVNDLRWGISRLRFIWLATFAAAGSAVLSLSKDMDKISESAIKLGMTSDELSKKMFGFNIFTPLAKEGVQDMKDMKNAAVSFWEYIKVGTAENIARLRNFLELQAQVTGQFQLAQMEAITPGVTGGAEGLRHQGAVDTTNKWIQEQSKMDAELWSAERLALEEQTTQKINQLRLSETDFARLQLEQQLAFLRKNKVDEEKVKQLAAESEKKIKQQEMANNVSNYATLWGMMSQTTQLAIGESKKYAAIMKAMNIGEAIINTATAYTKALAQGGFIFGISMANAVLALGMAQVAVIAAQPMAKGGEGIVTQPTLFLAGEAGAERFSFTPIRNGSRARGSGVTVYIENASFTSEDEAEDVLQRLSQLVDEKSRSRIA